MAIYVTSDIHGEYDLFVRLLDIIKLQDQDTLYVLGMWLTGDHIP